jgi:putative DNA primase/helicase
MDNMDNMHTYSLNGINVPPEVFLRTLFGLKETVCFRVFSDKPGSVFAGHKISCVLEGFSDVVDELRNHNERGRGVFFVINHGGHEDAQITRINAQFAEMDDISLEEQLKKIQQFPLEPSMIVKTRKSLHCYWLIKNANVGKFRHIQKRLIAQFGADAACINESRVFRLPGFMHCKEEPLLVECVKFNPELRYTQEQLEAVLPEIPDEPAPTGFTQTNKPKLEHGTQKGLPLVGRRCDFIKYCHRNAKTLPEPYWYAMISNLAVFEGGAEVIHKLSKPYPKYSHEQTQAKIDHFHKSGTNPMTCARIAERGFKCPKLGKNVCKCKSPAGLAFFPMTCDELEKALSKQKKTNSPTRDCQTAMQFVSDYLFNVDPAIAEPFINNEIKSHFGLKSEDKRPLISTYRGMYKEFNAIRDAHKIQEKCHKWYRCNKSGELYLMPGILAKHLAEEFNAFYCTEQYYFYNNGVYSPRTEKDAKAIVQTYLYPTDATLNQINDAEGQWQLRVRKEINEINPNVFVINCTNGLYNVIDDSFKPHYPEYFSTVQTKAQYNPAAKCERFMEFLYSALEEPEINLLQEIFGYFLVPITRAQKSFLLCGEPNVGKSTILTVLQELLLGAENVSNIPIQKLSDRFQPAELFGKLANIFADLPDKSISDAGMFKAVTGEDYITGERKHKDPFSFKPFARFLYSCNDIPRNYGDRSEAFYRRLIIIRFEKAVPPEKKDLQLIDKLRLESDGILAWAIVGLKRLIANNYQFSETDRTVAETHRYKVQNNNVLAFVEENCVIEKGAVAYRSEMFQAFREFCAESSSGKKMQEGRFYEEVCKIAPSKIKMAQESVSRKKTFEGIRLL